MPKDITDLDARLSSIEQRLDHMEKQALTRADLEKEIKALLNKQTNAQKNDCADWINAVLGT